MSIRIKIILVLVALSLAACAPVVYDSPYYAYSPHRQTDIQSSYHDDYYPIEVTLYASRGYGMFIFQPVHLVIYDGDYVEIPFKNRKGHHRNVYAHYHYGNFHFDQDKYCNNLKGSSRFTYNSRWEKGYRYSNVSAGSDFDLSGLQLDVRRHSEAERPDARGRIGKYATSSVSNDRLSSEKIFTQHTGKNKNTANEITRLSKPQKDHLVNRHKTPVTRETAKKAVIIKKRDINKVVTKQINERSPEAGDYATQKIRNIEADRITKKNDRGTQTEQKNLKKIQSHEKTAAKMTDAKNSIN